MSHKKLRIEKDCLNCGQTVEKRFCTYCGQENLELNDSAFHLIIHYFQDLFHYDGKFWHTFKYFMTRPGLVQEDYMAGKRQSHLKPIQFYVFASTIFFLIFFFVAEPSDNMLGTTSDDTGTSLYHLNQVRESLSGSADTILVDSLITGLQVATNVTTGEDSLLTSDFSWDLSAPALDPNESDGWLTKKIAERVMQRAKEMNAQHHGDVKSAVKAFIKELLHSFPQLMFLSLPFFALLLQLFYFRSERKRYVANFIFSVYYYAYSYIILFFYLLISWGIDTVHSDQLDTLWGWLTVGFVFYPLVYLYLSMRRFYHDKGFSLMLRYLALMFLFCITLFILFLMVTFLTFLI